MIQVFCDGGSRNNPGHAAYGYVVRQNGKVIKQSGAYIGIATNNFAEYTALIKALEWLSLNKPGSELIVNLDSLLAVSQLNGIYKVKNATIRELIVKVRELEGEFTKIVYRHIPRGQNWEADQLVNQALDQQATKPYGA